jgi:hypothetical protein
VALSVLGAAKNDMVGSGAMAERFCRTKNGLVFPGQKKPAGVAGGSTNAK